MIARAVLIASIRARAETPEWRIEMMLDDAVARCVLFSLRMCVRGVAAAAIRMRGGGHGALC